MPIFSSGYPAKSNPVDNDKILIADSEASGAIKGVSKEDFTRNLSGGILANVRTYTSSATWTKPSRLKFITVEVVGGGGAGGNSTGSNGSSTASSSGGGGAGGRAIKKILAQDLSSTESITIGAGGVNPAGAGVSGNAGGTTSFGSHVSASGGDGGTGSGTSSTVGTWRGGAGGVGSNGDLNIRGSRGGDGQVLSGQPLFYNKGGETPYGASAFVPFGIGNADPSEGYGVGGTGCSNRPIGPDTTARRGANGTSGLVIIHEYF